MEQDEKLVRMTTAPIYGLVGRLAVPTMVTMLVTAFYNMADTFFVGLLDNTSATGAVGVVFSFMAVIQAVGFTFGQGSGNTMSRLLGQGRREEAAHLASVAFFSAILVGVAITALGLTFLEPLARILGSTDTILPYAKQYLGLILCGAPWMIGALVLNNQLRFQGNAFYSMLGIGSGAVLNVVLDPVFIFTFNMGVAGAALATIISQLVSFGVLLFCSTRGDNIRVSVRRFHPKGKDYGEILRGGLPTLCRQSLSSISTVCLNLAAGVAGGDAAIAAMAVATKVMHLSFSALLGFGQGFQPVCGFNYGAKCYGRVRKAFWFCVVLGSALLSVASVVEWIFARQLIGLFSTDPAVIDIGVVSLRLLCVSFPLIAWTTMSNMMMQTIGRVVPASFLSLARQGVFFIPLVLGLPRLLMAVWGAEYGLVGVQMAQPGADILTFAVSIPMTITILRRYLPKE